MLRGILASFIGTFLALAAIGLAGLLVADRIVDRVVEDVSGRIEDRRATARTQAEAAAGRLAELTAFGACIESAAEGGMTTAAAVRACIAGRTGRAP